MSRYNIERLAEGEYGFFDNIECEYRVVISDDATWSIYSTAEGGNIQPDRAPEQVQRFALAPNEAVRAELATIDQGVTSYYLAEFYLYDNGHCHIETRVLAVDPENRARQICQREIYDYGEEPEDSLFGYGDGDTALTDYQLTPVSVEEYGVLSKYLLQLGGDLASLDDLTPKLHAIGGGKS